jgi:hypothetical protein
VNKLLIGLIILEVIFALIAFTPDAHTPILSIFINSPNNDLHAAHAALDTLDASRIEGENTSNKFYASKLAFESVQQRFEQDLYRWRRMKGISALVSICLLPAVIAISIIVVRKKELIQRIR